MSKDSKRFKEAKKAVEQGRVYSPMEAATLLKTLETANFDETVEVHIKLGVNPRHADQQVRGTVMLPHGTGKTVRVAVFAKGEKATEAEAAGADIVGADDLAAQVAEGMLDFDAAIATPDMMGVVGKLGRILGPRGLMPNPKAGTVTFDVAKAVVDMKAGKVEYRTDKFGVIHLIVGKKSFDGREAGRELRRGAGRDRPRQAGRRQGQVPAHHHHDEHHGPRHPAGYVQDPLAGRRRICRGPAPRPSGTTAAQLRWAAVFFVLSRIRSAATDVPCVRENGAPIAPGRRGSTAAGHQTLSSPPSHWSHGR